MGRKFGFSFSWKRAVGISALKSKISKNIGIPLTRQGRQRKIGQVMGCCVIFFALSTSFLALLSMLTYMFLFILLND